MAAAVAREDQRATGIELADLMAAAASAVAAREDADLSVPDEVEEQFELRGESTPYLRRCARREARMAAVPDKDAELLSDARRHVLGQFLSAVISQIWAAAGRTACPQKVWLDSMQLCDVLAARGLDFGEEGASAHAAAVLRLLFKAEDGTRTLAGDFLPKLTEVIRRSGLAVQHATPEDIDSAEGRILRCLGWQIWCPSLHSWLNAFFSRFDVLMKRHLAEEYMSEFGEIMTRLWQQCYNCGTAVVMRVASVGQMAPRSLAMGLLGLGCVHAGALPLQAARPEWLAAADWERVFVLAMGPVRPLREDPRAAGIRQIIQLATDSGMDAVGDACGRVALAALRAPTPGATGAAAA